MKQIKDFIYNDIVLYSKFWFKSSGNIIDDLGYLFSKVYAWTPKTEDEVAVMMLRVLDRLYDELELERHSQKVSGKWLATHSQFEAEVIKNERLYNCSRYMAIIKTVLHVLHCLDSSEIKLNKPHYGKKEKFRLGGLFEEHPISMTYAEMNRIATKMFG